MVLSRHFHSFSWVSFIFAVCSVEAFGPTTQHVKYQLQGNYPRALSRRGITNICSSTQLNLSPAPIDIVVSMYKDALNHSPLETKLITGGALAFLGDAIAQSKDEEYDKKRAAAFVAFDMVYRAVQCALFPYITETCDGHFFKSLLPIVPLSDQNQMLDMHFLATLEQTCANQFIIIPIIYYPVFFSLTGWVQGLSLEATMERVQSTIVPLLKRNWAFWIPVQYFQFGYVDEPLQIPFLCAVGLAWTFILSTSAGSTKNYADEDSIEAPTLNSVNEELVVSSETERIVERV